MIKLSLERKQNILMKLAEEFNVLKEQKKALRLAKRRKLYPSLAPYDAARRLGGTKPTQYELAAQKSKAKRMGVADAKYMQLADINNIRREAAKATTQYGYNIMGLDPKPSEAKPGTPSGYHDILRKKSIGVEPRELNNTTRWQRQDKDKALEKKQLSQRAAARRRTAIKTEIKKRQDTAQQSLPLTKLRREASGG